MSQPSFITDQGQASHPPEHRQPQKAQPNSGTTEVNQDFGHLIQGAAKTIARPKHTAEIVRLLQMANRAGLTITPRGKGYSQSGQSVSVNGITLETIHLKQLKFIDNRDHLICGAGVSWRTVMTMAMQAGRLPCAMPLNLNLTIGGTLSAGGVGSNSHRYGSSTASVTALEVVTGAAQAITCDPTQHPDLFQAVLSGQGRCGLITSATLKLRPFKPQVILYQLLYTDLGNWLADQQRLKTNPAISHIEGFCLGAEADQWRYKLHIAIEQDSTAIDHTILEPLSYDEVVQIDCHGIAEFLARYDCRFQAMQQAGDWQLAHPWFECFIPSSQAKQLIPKMLKILPACFGEGHRVIPIDTTTKTKFFMTPELPEQSILFAALPTGIKPADISATRQAIRELNELIMAAGGKRYLSGWLETTSEGFWQQHFGALYTDWLQVKQTYDPNQVFGSSLFRGDPAILMC
ncbi:FAD-binding protein [filamentous cyanobacterium LEGE 11480]|uniref:FAD-binding protein n=1 Tax=Romeriopsis navalis LEGE 11480 TaxID=2777977 RepID=A0A928VV44_9CYAN|nr:FAD-binding protein [Romeriopsis navalis]MBE9033145.1 FAD-binding protein [Romeriopsis navalis LEGE 11480]